MVTNKSDKNESKQQNTPEPHSPIAPEKLNNFDYYNFNYEHVQAALNKHMPALIEIISDMTSDLMWHETAPLLDDTGNWTSDKPLFDEDTGNWTDTARHDEAHKSIIRQLLSLLDQVIPPVWDADNYPFIVRSELTVDYAKQWLQETANSGRDDLEKQREAALEIIFAEIQEREANAPIVNNEAITETLAENMPGLFYEFDMNIDKAMARHNAVFLNATDNPDVIEDDYEDKELHKAVSLAVCKAMASFYRNTLPKVLEAYNTPFIFPTEAIEHARNELQGVANE